MPTNVLDIKSSCIICQMKLGTESISHGCKILLKWTSQRCFFLLKMNKHWLNFRVIDLWNQSLELLDLQSFDFIVSKEYTVGLLSEMAVNVLSPFTTTYLYASQGFLLWLLQNKIQTQSQCVGWCSTIFIANKSTHR